MRPIGQAFAVILMSFLPAAAHAFPSSWKMAQQCVDTLKNKELTQAFDPSRVNLLQEQIWGNGRFPQVDDGVTLNLVSAYFSRPMAATQFLERPDAEEIQAFAAAMNQSHKYCNVPDRFSGTDATEPSTKEVSQATLEGYLVTQRRTALRKAHELMRELGKGLPRSIRKPSLVPNPSEAEYERYLAAELDDIFKNRENKEIASVLFRVGIVIRSVLRSPQVTQNATRYRDFLRLNPLKSDRRARVEAFSPVHSAMFGLFQKSLKAEFSEFKTKKVNLLAGMLGFDVGHGE
jgi:hypothetical protein